MDMPLILWEAWHTTWYVSVLNISLALPMADISTYWKVFHSTFWEFVWWPYLTLKDKGLIPTGGRIFLFITTHWPNCGVQLISCPVCTGGSCPGKDHSEAGRVFDFHILCLHVMNFARWHLANPKVHFILGVTLLLIFMNVGLTHPITPRLGFMGMNHNKDTY
jgi:hypothetical protein